MAQVTIAINIDEYDRDRFYEFCDAAGLDASTAFRIFIKAVLRENRIPFEISLTPMKQNEQYKEIVNHD